MNQRYREWMQKYSAQAPSPTQDEADEKMIQMFGETTSSSVENRFLLDSIQTALSSFSIGEPGIKRGYVLFSISLLLLSVVLFVHFQWVDGIGSFISSIISLFLSRKVQYRYSETTNYFFHNFTVTLKALIQHYRLGWNAMGYAREILIYSVVFLTIQSLLFSWLSVSWMVSEIAYYTLIAGIVLNLAKRETFLISKGLFFYSLLLGGRVLLEGLGDSHLLNYQNIISFFVFWYLAGFFQSLKIENMSIKSQ